MVEIANLFIVITTNTRVMPERLAREVDAKGFRGDVAQLTLLVSGNQYVIIWMYDLWCLQHYYFLRSSHRLHSSHVVPCIRELACAKYCLKLSTSYIKILMGMHVFWLPYLKGQFLSPFFETFQKKSWKVPSKKFGMIFWKLHIPANIALRTMIDTSNES